MQDFRQFQVGPDPYGRTWRVSFLWQQNGISIRHADTVDVKFLTDDGETREEKIIALPHPALVDVAKRIGRPLNDAWCSKIAAFHLRKMILTAEDVEKPLVTLSTSDIELANRDLDRERSAASASGPVPGSAHKCPCLSTHRPLPKLRNAVLTMERMVRVEAVIDSWKTVRHDTAQAVLDMPDLDFQPTSELMKFRDLAVHTLNAGHALVGLLLDGVDNMATPEFRERMSTYFFKVPPDADHQTIAAALNSAVEDDARRLRSMDADFWSHLITRFDGQTVTRLEMLQFTKEHELTHRSQMFMYLRLKGIMPPTTRRKLARK